jgi:1-phosphofructokinase
MIYTVTLNPAIDYVAQTDNFRLGTMNRNRVEDIQYGGKGINVARMLCTLGQTDCLALGFVAGFTGQALEEGVQHQGVQTEFLHLAEGLTRINVKIRAQEETELNGIGPTVGAEDWQRLKEQLARLEQGDVLVLSGAVAPGLTAEAYGKLLDVVAGKGVRTIVDADGPLLRSALKKNPWLVKPNQEELSRFFHVQLRTESQRLDAARALKDMGASNVLVSCGGEGAILLDVRGGIHICPAPEGAVRNSVGAGDSMVAGFLAGWLASQDYDYALRLGVAAGSATAFSLDLAAYDGVMDCLRKIK